MSRLGDIYSRKQEPYQAYWDVIEKQKILSSPPPTLSPKLKIPEIPELKSFQKLLDEHFFPKLWSMLLEFKKELTCGLYFIKNPNWIEPPITSIPIDLFTNQEITLIAGGGFHTILSYTIPDRFIAVIQGIGQALESSSAFSVVAWNILINNRPYLTYNNFRIQLGTINSPTKFPKPIILKYGDTIELQARNFDVVNHNAWARLTGYAYSPKKLTADGSFEEFHNL